MANICEITGKRKLRGNRVSHANNKSIHFQQPNIQHRAVFIPELGTTYRLKVSTSGLRTLDKVGGLSRFVVRADPETLSPRLRQLRKVLIAHAASPVRRAA